MLTAYGDISVTGWVWPVRCGLEGCLVTVLVVGLQSEIQK